MAKKYWLAPLFTFAVTITAMSLLLQHDCAPIWKPFGAMVILTCP